jgi:surface protein
VFCGLSAESIDAAGLDTSSVVNMSSMFSGCTSLISIDGLAGWDVSSVTTMTEMFSGCASLSLDSVNKFEAHHAELTADFREIK